MEAAATVWGERHIVVPRAEAWGYQQTEPRDVTPPESAKHLNYFLFQAAKITTGSRCVNSAHTCPMARSPEIVVFGDHRKERAVNYKQAGH